MSVGAHGEGVRGVLPFLVEPLLLMEKHVWKEVNCRYRRVRELGHRSRRKDAKQRLICGHWAS